MTSTTVLVANRGAIATRIIRTLRSMGLRSVAVYSEADAGSLHVTQADEAVCIGPAPAVESYLNAAKIIEVARETGAGFIHPGYGFLAENADFAEACAAAGIVFIGPTPDNIRTFGLKHSARALAAENGVPLAPGTGLLTDAETAMRAANEIGYPVILKATAGGGGIGMRICEDEAASKMALPVWRALAKAILAMPGSFSNAISPARGISRFRYLAMGRAVFCRLANAIVPCSAETKKWSKKRLHPGLIQRCGKNLSPQPFGWARLPNIAPLERLSFCSMRKLRNFTSLR